MDDVIVELMEPMRFGQSMMHQLFYKGADRTNKKAKFTGGDYPDLCYKLKTLVNDVQHQRDMWKDRFFFRAIDADKMNCVWNARKVCDKRFTTMEMNLKP